jgi:PAS domain S-box-containing protein
MKRVILSFLLMAISLFAQTSKEVLLIHSYDKSYKWSDDISKGIESYFKPYKSINLTTVYMDTKRISTPQYYENLKRLYQEQFKNRNFDLIIASNNNALEFLNSNHDDLFTQTPVLFCGINNFTPNLINHLPLVSGVVEEVDIEKNFQLIKLLHPHLKKLIIVNDHSTTGLQMKQALMPYIQKYQKEFEIVYLDDIYMPSIKEQISLEKKEHTALLFVLLFKDKIGQFYTYKQSLKDIKSISDIPIYGLWDFYLNHGVIGGYVTSAKAQGNKVASMAVRYLIHGVDIKQLRIIDKSPNEYQFDYIELLRFNIHLPQSLNPYTIINEPKSIYKEYRNFVILSFFIITVLIILIIVMRANIQRRKVVEKDLSNRIKFDQALLDTLPNPIYYKNTNGKFLGCNLSFAKLFSCNKQEVVGKTAFDFFPENIASKNVEIDHHLMQHQGTYTTELTLHFDDKMRYFILNKAAYENIHGDIGGIVCIMDDITQRIQEKQFLIQQSKLAEMGDMVAAIAHQWNEPLVELSAQIQDIELSYKLNEIKKEQMQSFVKESMIQIQYMSKTLSDFRNFLKPSTKKALFDVKKALDEIFEIIGKQIFYSNIHFNIYYENPKEELLVYGYENEFKQVLLNIINNAKNKILNHNLNHEERYTITLHIFSNKKYTIIEIADNAGAIDKKIIGNIFDPYFTTKKEGTGFGLYMAKIIIEDKMRGKIRVRNENNSVIFTIKVPNKQTRELP